jgi:2Fe-2S ferredoxin
MPTVVVTTRGGEEKVVQVAAGLSLMEGLRAAGIDEIEAVCGGCAACCTCHVYIRPGSTADLGAMSEQEDALLDSSDARTANSRLSCQINVNESLDGLRITVAPEM